MNPKKLEKLEKTLGADTIAEISAKSADDLKSLIVAAESAINQAVDELEANPHYQELKENLKALTAGLREVKKRQKAIIDYSLLSLETKNQE